MHDPQLKTTIGLGKAGAVFLVCWDEELITSKYNGEVLVVGWRHARIYY